MKNFLLFAWTVCKDGYQVIETMHAYPQDREVAPEDSDQEETDTPVCRHEQFLTPGVPDSHLTRDRLRRYRLADAPDAFVEFGSLQPDTHAIRAFAARYGMLTRGNDILLPQYRTSEGTPSGPGEPLALWFDQIRQMACALDLWRILKAGDTATLAKRVHRNTQGLPVSYTFRSSSFESGESIVNPIAPQPWFTPTRQKNVLTLGWFVLQQIINRNLAGSATPRLLWEPVEGGSRLGLYFSPTTLQDALWLQCAQAVSRNASYQQCGYCRRPFLVGVGGKRAHADFCKATCRNMAYKKRKTAPLLPPVRRKRKTA